MVVNNRLRILLCRNLVQQLLQLDVKKMIEVLLRICLLEVFVAPFRPCIDLPPACCMSGPFPSCPLDTRIHTGFGFLRKEHLAFSLSIEDPRIRSERVLDIFRYVYRSGWVASNAHVDKGSSKPVNGRLLHNCRLNIELNPGNEICRVKATRVRVMSHDLVANSRHRRFSEGRQMVRQKGIRTCGPRHFY